MQRERKISQTQVMVGLIHSMGPISLGEICQAIGKTSTHERNGVSASLAQRSRGVGDIVRSLKSGRWMKPGTVEPDDVEKVRRTRHRDIAVGKVEAKPCACGITTQCPGLNSSGCAFKASAHLAKQQQRPRTAPGEGMKLERWTGQTRCTVATGPVTNLLTVPAYKPASAPRRPGAEDYRAIPSLMGDQRQPYQGIATVGLTTRDPGGFIP